MGEAARRAGLGGPEPVPLDDRSGVTGLAECGRRVTGALDGEGRGRVRAPHPVRLWPGTIRVVCDCAGQRARRPARARDDRIRASAAGRGASRCDGLDAPGRLTRRVLRILGDMPMVECARDDVRVPLRRRLLRHRLRVLAQVGRVAGATAALPLALRGQLAPVLGTRLPEPVNAGFGGLEGTASREVDACRPLVLRGRS